MVFQPNFTRDTEGNRLSITVASNDIEITEDTRQPPFWHQLMRYLEQNKQITELSLVLENQATYSALFPQGEELSWVFVLSNVRHLLLSTKPQAKDRISKNHKETNINGNKCFLYPPLSTRNRTVKDAVVSSFITQYNTIKEPVSSGEEHTYQTNQTLPVIKTESNASYEADMESWMSFFLHNVAMPEVYFLPLVIGFIALLASNGMGMAIIGGGIFAVGVLGAGLNFFSPGVDEFEDRYYTNPYHQPN